MPSDVALLYGPGDCCYSGGIGALQAHVWRAVQEHGNQPGVAGVDIAVTMGAHMPHLIRDSGLQHRDTTIDKLAFTSM